MVKCYRQNINSSSGVGRNQLLIDENQKLRLYRERTQPFNLMKGVSDSLAGRVGILDLFPLTPFEIAQSKKFIFGINETQENPPRSDKAKLFYPPNEHLLRGGFPAMSIPRYSQSEEIVSQRLKDYVLTYVTKDLREISLIKDLSGLKKFHRTLALYSSKILYLSAIANQIGIKQSTLHNWQPVLEASYLFWKIPGYAHNLGQRESKSPKAVPIDSGLQAKLLGYERSRQVDASPLNGAIFETAVLNALRSTLARGKNMIYWRLDEQREVDCIIENTIDEPIPIEIKTTGNPNSEDLVGLKSFMESYPKAKKWNSN